MTHEMETTLLDLKDQLLDAIHQVDELLYDGQQPVRAEQGDDDPDELDPDDEDFEDDPDEEQEELVVDGVVDPPDAGRKREKPIDYSGMQDRRTTAFKKLERTR